MRTYTCVNTNICMQRIHTRLALGTLGGVCETYIEEETFDRYGKHAIPLIGIALREADDCRLIRNAAYCLGEIALRVRFRALRITSCLCTSLPPSCADSAFPCCTHFSMDVHACDMCTYFSTCHSRPQIHTHT